MDQLHEFFNAPFNATNAIYLEKVLEPEKGTGTDKYDAKEGFEEPFEEPPDMNITTEVNGKGWCYKPSYGFFKGKTGCRAEQRPRSKYKRRRRSCSECNGVNTTLWREGLCDTCSNK